MRERDIIIELLKEKIVGVNYMRYLYWGSNEVDGQTLVMFVICSELFYLGADAEDIKDEKGLFELYDLYKKHKSSGVDIWAIKKRKEKPLKSIENSLKEQGLWLEEFNSYKENEN